jgi:hypothetical protein
MPNMPVGVVRVFDGEIVRLELPLRAGQERHIQLVQPDPDHRPGLLRQLAASSMAMLATRRPST